MSKAKKRRPKSARPKTAGRQKPGDRPAVRRRRAEESRRAEAATVGWVVALLSTLMAQVVFAAAWALEWAAGSDRPDDALRMLPA